MDRSDLSPGEWLLVLGAAAVGGLGAVVWAGGWLAAASGGERLHAGFGDALAAATRLPSHLSDPARAWDPAAAPALPGPAPYWAATAAVATVAVVLVALVVRLVGRSRVGTRPRRPLGVDARARFATAADLAPLTVRGDHPGRFLLGRHGRRSLATEAAPTRRRRRRRRHRGDAGAVALVGPSRCGKTTAAVSGILAWEGPAVLSSVKADLLAAT